MRHRDEVEDGWDQLVRKLVRLVDLVIARLESSETPTTKLHLDIQGEPMANFPLNAGDSVVVTVTDTDTVTGAVVVPDAGSVTAVLSSSTDTIAENADGTFTITAGTVAGTGNTVTVNATVGGVASAEAVGTYDVVAVVAADPTALSVAFGTETEPAAPAASNVGLAAGQVNPTTGLINP